MSALKRKEIGKVRAEDAVGMIDCGQASKRTKGTYLLLFLEYGVPPLNWLFLLPSESRLTPPVLAPHCRGGDGCVRVMTGVSERS